MVVRATSQICSQDVSLRSLAYHLIIRIPGRHGCLGNGASGKESIYSCVIASYSHLETLNVCHETKIST